MNKKFAIIAHRGASSYVKENTLEAFLLAEKQNAPIIELDVRRTLDGVLVISHERGMKKGRKNNWIDKHSYSVLNDLFPRGLLKLQDVFETLSKKTVLDIDVKQKGFEKELSDFIITSHREKTVIIDTFHPGSIVLFRRYLPKTPLGLSFAMEDKRDIGKRRSIRFVLSLSPYLIRRLISPVITRVARNCRCDIVNMHSRFANKKNIDLLHAIGIQVYVWRVDKEKSMKKLISLGVDGIKTGKPDLLRRVIDEHYR